MKKQIAALTLATTLGLSIQPIVSSAETAQNTQATQQSGWVKEESGTWFFYENGAKKTGWLALEGKWYYLDPNAGGAMKLGWAQVEGKWYYLNANDGGAMKIGWEKVDGKWYYLDGNNGGAMKTGWLQDNGKWYYLNANDGGAMKTGWLQDNGKWYYLNADDGGAMKTGWFQEGSTWYYLDANQGGAMVTGQLQIDNKWQYFTSSGHWVKVLDVAQNYLGVPYVWGGKDARGLDCSGFVYYSWNQAGYSRAYQTSQGLYNNSQSISRANAEPGDLVFFSESHSASNITHVAIYLGGDDIIEAASGNSMKVKYSKLSTSWYSNNLVGFGRITDF
ncbi:C40 family peptidase [Bacillus sp. XF8]|uniref:NlpC/P60 family protein n=1 Tax=Bacillus sp. XF8 TaxID=2819289 RepID=UPI001AA08017|nr:C40 family peptidase [Bacillus sp. XF8]